MRKGKLVGVEETKNVNERMLASMMVGRPVLYDQLEKTGTPGAEEIRVENLTVQDNRGLTAVDGLSLSVRARSRGSACRFRERREYVGRSPDQGYQRHRSADP